MRAFLATAVATLLIIGPAFAGDNEAESDNKPVNIEVPALTTFVISHSGQFNGEQVEYSATAGETYLKERFDVH